MKTATARLSKRALTETFVLITYSLGCCLNICKLALKYDFMARFSCSVSKNLFKKVGFTRGKGLALSTVHAYESRVMLKYVMQYFKTFSLFGESSCVFFFFSSSIDNMSVYF